MWRGYLPDRIQYIYAAATEIDPKNRNVQCETKGHGGDSSSASSFNLEYDVLVLGTGATTNTFNTKGVDEYCHFMKETGDATLLRQAVLANLERASLPGVTPEQQRQLLSFYVVGGGPTAVEVAAELQDFLHYDVVNPEHAQYNKVTGKTSVTLVQSNVDGKSPLYGIMRKTTGFSFESCV